MTKSKPTYASLRARLLKRYALYLCVLVAVIGAVAFACHTALSATVETTFKNNHIQSRIELSERLQHYARARDTMSKEQLLYSLVNEIDTFATREKESILTTLVQTYHYIAPGIVLLLLLIGSGTILFSHTIHKKVYQHTFSEDNA